jgi:hypothetical protein
MDRLTGALAFLDIGNTLASVTISSSGNRIEKLTVYPYVPSVFGELRDRGARLGVRCGQCDWCAGRHTPCATPDRAIRPVQRRGARLGGEPGLRS